MQVDTLPHPVDADGDDSDPNHWFCSCTPDVAFCGADVSGLPVLDDETAVDGADCQLCGTLWEANGRRCVRCGE